MHKLLDDRSRFQLLDIRNIHQRKPWQIAVVSRADDRDRGLPGLEHVVVDGGNALFTLVAPKHDDLPHFNTIHVPKICNQNQLNKKKSSDTKYCKLKSLRIMLQYLYITRF